MPRGASGWVAAGGVLLITVIGLLWVGCSEDTVSAPESPPTNELVAHYQSPEDFERGLIELNGERIETEWGGEASTERPFTHVRVSQDDGAGHPGAPRYVSMKAVYTDEHLYVLAQWSDPGPSVLKDAFFYAGPSLGAPVINCVHVGGETICDSLFRTGPQDSLLSAAWWYRFGDDDKFAIAFEQEAASDARGTFADLGCRVACHPGSSPAFGPMARGRLDLWYWLAGRTNPIRNIFNPFDDPADPSQGVPGYLDDWYIDRSFGLAPDPGKPGYWSNVEPGGRTPKWVYRREDDKFADPPEPHRCRNEFREQCRPNNGVAYTYLWRESATEEYDLFSAGDTLNESIVPDARKWQTADLVPGYLLSYPRGSRADVRGKGGYEDDTRVWTLEIARLLDTGDPLSDVIFDPDSGARYYFTIAVFDAATRTHWGSEPQVLVFGPKRNGGG